MKKAILLASYGTANQTIWEKTVGRIGSEIRGKVTDWDVFDAFTGRRMIEKWREMGCEVMNEAQGLERLAAQGYQRVVVLPTHLIAGKEYEQVSKAVGKYQDFFETIRLGRPLLETQAQRCKVAAALRRELRPEQDETMIFIGHGTEHAGNTVYAKLEEEWIRLGCKSVIVGILGEADRALQRVETKRVKLIPLLLTAGKHTLKDITGMQEGSIACRLRAAGCDVQAIEKGMGEYTSIRAIYEQQLEELLEQ